MDSTGLHVLVNAHQRAQEGGRRFVLTRGGEQVQRLLDLTGVTELVSIVDSPAELLEADRASDALLSRQSPASPSRVPGALVQ